MSGGNSSTVNSGSPLPAAVHDAYTRQHDEPCEGQKPPVVTDSSFEHHGVPPCLDWYPGKKSIHGQWINFATVDIQLQFGCQLFTRREEKWHIRFCLHHMPRGSYWSSRNSARRASRGTRGKLLHQILRRTLHHREPRKVEQRLAEDLIRGLVDDFPRRPVPRQRVHQLIDAGIRTVLDQGEGAGRAPEKRLTTRRRHDE